MTNMIKQITIIIIVALVFFSLGYFISFTSSENDFQAGWVAAKQRLAETGFMPPLMEDMEITSISGTIQDILLVAKEFILMDL